MSPVIVFEVVMHHMGEVVEFSLFIGCACSGSLGQAILFLETGSRQSHSLWIIGLCACICEVYPSCILKTDVACNHRQSVFVLVARLL